MPDKTEQPIRYVSRTHSKAEQNYSQLNRERRSSLCVLHKTIPHLSIWTSLHTHHRSQATTCLIGEEKAIPQQTSPRIQRWALTLSMYDYSLKFKGTAEHSNADALSRLPLPHSVSPVVLPEIVMVMELVDKTPIIVDILKTWTRKDKVLSRVSQYVITGWPETTTVEPYRARSMELSTQDGCLLWGNRVTIPPQRSRTVVTRITLVPPRYYKDERNG